MAIYDPPNGSVDPRPRCVGHCCRCFSIEHPYALVQEQYRQQLAHPNEPKASIPDIAVIGAMLIPQGVVRGQEIFTCKNLSKDGNCTIYETRPQMCRDFPGSRPCPYRNCASHGRQPRWRRIVNWFLE